MENKLFFDMGQRMAKIRQHNGLTQAALAEKLGVSPKHISHSECGTSSLSLKNLIAVSIILSLEERRIAR